MGLDGLKVKGCGSFRVQGRRLSLGFKGSGLKPLNPQKGLKDLRIVGSGLFEGMRLTAFKGSFIADFQLFSLRLSPGLWACP